jgi:hypothetical protein
MNSLPYPYQEGFRLKVIPFLRQIMGSIAGPWDLIPEDEIRYAWSGAFPDDQSQLDDDRVAVISKLVSFRL